MSPRRARRGGWGPPRRSTRRMRPRFGAVGRGLARLGSTIVTVTLAIRGLVRGILQRVLRPVVGGLVAGVRARPRGVLGAVLVLAVAAGLLRIGPPAWTWLVQHPYFAVEEIVMSPTRRVQPGELLRWAGVRPGMSIWQTSPSELAERIGGHPWVRSATVRRELPRRLVIDLRERESMALLSLDRLYHVDRRGVVFAALGDDDPLDLPLITGLGETAASRRRALREAIKVLQLVRAQGLSFRVSEVHIQQEQGVRLFPVEPALALTFGWGGSREKVHRLQTVLASFAGREGRIREIDLTFDDEAVVRFKGNSGVRQG